MRYLGVDYGSKRVGVAISDEDGGFAFPLVVLDASDDLILKIKEICEKNGVVEIVVGESKNFEGKENEIMKEINPFVKTLEKELLLPVHMHPEFMTSLEAERLQGKNEMHDASAAALILKSFLETKTNKII